MIKIINKIDIEPVIPKEGDVIKGIIILDTSGDLIIGSKGSSIHSFSKKTGKCLSDTIIPRLFNPNDYIKSEEFKIDLLTSQDEVEKQVNRLRDLITKISKLMPHKIIKIIRKKTNRKTGLVGSYDFHSKDSYIKHSIFATKIEIFGREVYLKSDSDYLSPFRICEICERNHFHKDSTLIIDYPDKEIIDNYKLRYNL
jgi:hypothetical protein